MPLSPKWLWFVKVHQLFLMWMKKLYWYFDLRKILISASIVIIAVLAILPFVTEKKVRYLPCQVHPSAHNLYRFNQDNSGPPFYEEIVPNIVHFYRTGKDVNEISFFDALCLYAAFRIANPEKIMIHTDDVLAVTYSFTRSSYGKRLMQVLGFKKALDIQYWPVPKHVFGIEFSNTHRNRHIKDVTRLRILRKYGGIFLDNNSFLLKNPKQLRHYEMTTFEKKDKLINYLIIAHRDARMLDLWLKSYHRYDPDIQTHHRTDFVNSLFAQKTTFYHKFENGAQDGNINMLNGENGLQFNNQDSCYVLYLTKLKDNNVSEDNEFDFESDYFVNLVDKHISNMK
ncbi:uncharacterized protein LOC142329262 isoform X4 [Lycorma delicatula]|uniref:uncharacterized protein LOC142329262 isoform X4 n=1 Tax=Lycorma delicatula TaxID=130591 RepID=UPI003F5199B3